MNCNSQAMFRFGQTLAQGAMCLLLMMIVSPRSLLAQVPSVGNNNQGGRNNPACTPGTIECPTRGDDLPWHGEDVPYVLSPRRTLVVEQQPALRWHPVAGATAYLVRLEKNGDTIWQTRTTMPEIPVGTIPRLDRAAQASYRFVVEIPQGKASIEEPSLAGGLAFRVATLTEVAALQSGLAAIESQNLPAPEKALRVADYYWQRGFQQAGIDHLEQAIAAGTESFSIELALGDRYGQALLLALPAERHCRRAIDLAKPDTPNIELAAAQACAGWAAAGLGNLTEAKQRLTEARDRYGAAGAIDQVRFLNGKLQQL